MAEEMGLFETIYNCRAMRRLDTTEVPEEQLIKLVDAANQAPSGSNMQGARWIVVRDSAVKQTLADLNRPKRFPSVTPGSARTSRTGAPSGARRRACRRCLRTSGRRSCARRRGTTRYGS